MNALVGALAGLALVWLWLSALLALSFVLRVRRRARELGVELPPPSLSWLVLLVAAPGGFFGHYFVDTTPEALDEVLRRLPSQDDDPPSGPWGEGPGVR